MYSEEDVDRQKQVVKKIQEDILRSSYHESTRLTRALTAANRVLRDMQKDLA